MQNYCDIVPHATGWIYIIDGIQSECFYHTYDLALDAAREQIARKGGSGDKVFRRQALNGEMLPVSVMAKVMPGAAGKASMRS